MVRQAYLHRMVLGRSPYEPPLSDTETDVPNDHRNSAAAAGASVESIRADQYAQQYNARGHPENRASRQLGRRSRRAQNDILSTIGVCVSVDEYGKVISVNGEKSTSFADKNLAMMNLRENMAGFRLGMVHDILHGLLTIWCSNIRKRIMTFDFYLTIPVMAIIKAEWRHMGHFKFFFAGLLPTIALHLSVFVMETGLDTFRGYLQSHFMQGEATRKHPRMRTMLLGMINFGMTATLFCVFVAPIQFLITLQRLDLVSSWIILPKLKGSPMSRLLLPQLPVPWKQATFPVIMRSIMRSPLVGLAISAWVGTSLDTRLNTYCNALAPRPDNPDTISFKTETVDGNYIELPVQSLPILQPSLKDEWSKDKTILKYEICEIRDFVQGFFRKLAWKAHAVFNGFQTLPDLNQQALPSEHEVRFADETLTRSDSLPAAGSEHNFSSSRDPEHQNGVEITSNSSPPLMEGSTTPPTAPQSQGPSAPISRRSSGTVASSDLEPSNVQVRARAGSSSTLHMDLEVNAAAARSGGPVYTSSFAASPHRSYPLASDELFENASLHRVTALTLHPSQSLGLQLSSMANTILRLPIIAVYQRSIAQTWLSVQDDPERIWLKENIFPAFGPTPLQYGWQAIGVYTAKIAVCLSLEAISGMMVWRMSSVFAWALGTRRFSWGRL